VLFKANHIVKGTEKETCRLASCGKGLPEFDVRVLRERYWKNKDKRVHQEIELVGNKKLSP
jgi:hypothetical protein